MIIDFWTSDSKLFHDLKLSDMAWIEGPSLKLSKPRRGPFVIDKSYEVAAFAIVAVWSASVGSFGTDCIVVIALVRV